MSNNPISVLLVVAQVLLFVYIVLGGQLFAKNVLFFILEWAGIYLFIWAYFILRRRTKVQATPEVAKGAKLVTEGPYKYVRHPLYAAILLIVFSLIADLYTEERLLIGMLLFSVLVIKIQREEMFLTKRFVKYSSYAKNVRRLIPFVY